MTLIRTGFQPLQGGGYNANKTTPPRFTGAHKHDRFTAAAPHTKHVSETDSATVEPVEHTLIMSLAGEKVRTSCRTYGNLNAKKVIFCAHGWTRNSQDFDYLARQNAGEDCLVVAPDFVGRGNSDWFRWPYNILANSKYDLPTYLDQTKMLMDHFKLKGRDLTWIGTSMGGLIGTKLAGEYDTPIKRLVLNDVGPCITRDAFDELVTHTNNDDGRVFKDVKEAAEYFKQRLEGYGKLSEAQWERIARTSLHFDPSRKVYRMHYDPKITEGPRLIKAFFSAVPHWLDSALNYDLWDTWDRIRTPILVLRGAKSSVLSPETVFHMEQKANTKIVEIPETGHAPSLMVPSQVRLIQDWIAKHS